MTGFREVPFDEAIDFREGPGIMARDFLPEGVPLVRLKGLERGAPLLAGCNYLDPEKVALKWNHFRLELGDVLLSTSATLGRVAEVDASAVGAVPYTGIIRMRPRTTDLDRRFIRYLLQGPHFQEQVRAMGVGSVMNHFGPSHLRSMTVLLPDVREQRLITDVLVALDDKIDMNRRVADGAEALAATEMAVAADNAEWVELGEITEHQKTSVDPATIDGDVDHFSIPAFDAARLPVREPGTTIKSNKLIVPDRAVLVSRLNPRIPRVWFARTTQGVPAVCSTEFLVLRPKAELAEGELYAACSQPAVLADMARRAGGTSGSHQRIKPADALSVAVPNAGSEQLRAALTPLLETAAHARAESATLIELRDTLLPKLLSGELRVGDAEDELEEAGV